MDHLWTPWRMAYIRGEKKPVEGCVFCTLAADFDNDTQVIARSEHVFVTLNLYPYNNGHLMVVPYEHVQSQEAMPPEALTDLMLTVNRAIGALRKALQSGGVQPRREYRRGGGRGHRRALSLSRRPALERGRQLHDRGRQHPRDPGHARKHLSRTEQAWQVFTAGTSMANNGNIVKQSSSARRARRPANFSARSRR